MPTLRCPTCHREYEEAFLKCPYDGATLIDAAATDTGDPMIGRQLAETYQLVRKLGSGGMGAVYEARHLRLQSSFAIKLLHPQLSINEEVLARFHREARSASQLNHPNIIDVFDVNKTPDHIHYIVQEFLDGQPLSDLLQEHPVLSVDRGAPILAQVCDAMEAAHAREIVHRDLKPENIYLIEKQGRADFVKVLDFGIAKMQETGTKLTQATTAMGTPDYISPEQAVSAGTADFRSDIYSLGVVVYRLFTGRLPYEIENPIFALDAVRTKEPVSARERRPDLPPAIEAVIVRAMQRDPAQRFGSMSELKQALLGLTTIPRTRAYPQISRGAVDPATDPGTMPTIAPVTAPRGQVTGPHRPDSVPPAMQGAVTGPHRPDSVPPTMAGGGPTPMAAGQLRPTTASQQQGGGKGPLLAVLITLLAVVVVAGGGAGTWWLMTSADTDDPPAQADASVARDPDSAPAPVHTAPAPAAPTAKMILIKGGTFQMGRARSHPVERPVHRCTVDDFFLDVEEVTRAAFGRFLGTEAGKDLAGNTAFSRLASTGPAADLPITRVSWEEARRYCRSVGKRLPTEIEWEYAAHGGADHAGLYPTGATPPGPEVANFTRPGKPGQLRAASPPVGGLSDMVGNAAEWVEDRFGWYTRTCGKRRAARGKLSSFRMIRGGAFDDKELRRLTATSRIPQHPAQFRWPSVGFRCARDAGTQEGR